MLPKFKEPVKRWCSSTLLKSSFAATKYPDRSLRVLQVTSATPNKSPCSKGGFWITACKRQYFTRTLKKRLSGSRVNPASILPEAKDVLVDYTLGYTLRINRPNYWLKNVRSNLRERRAIDSVVWISSGTGKLDCASGDGPGGGAKAKPLLEGRW